MDDKSLITINKVKQHNFLKVLIIFAAVGMVFGINGLSNLIVSDRSNLGQILLGDLFEIIVISGIILLWIKAMPQMFPATKIYIFKRVTIYQIMMVLGIALLSFIGTNRILYLIRGGEAKVTMIPFEFDSKAEFLEDMMASIHAVLIAPVLEEMGFRVIPASVIQTKKRRFVAIAILAFIFAAVHTRNFAAVLIDVALYSVLFLMTRNPLIPILCHLFGNLLKNLAGAAAYWGIINVSVTSDSGLIILFSTPVTIIAVIMGIALIMPSVISRCKQKTIAQQISQNH